jgi:hypothetical protein
MAAQKQFETRVEVTGGVDSSLQKAIGERRRGTKPAPELHKGS